MPARPGSGIDIAEMERTQAQGSGLEIDAGLIARIDGAVRRVMAARRNVASHDIEDICSDCMVALVQSLRGEPERVREIAHLDAYLMLLARRACSAWTRRKYPEFHRLRVRLRYLLQSNPRFAVWEDASGAWLCSMAEHRSRTPNLHEQAVEGLDALQTEKAPAAVVQKILTKSGRPVLFNSLVKLCAQLWSIQDNLASSEEDTEIVAIDFHPEAALDGRARLRKLWAEILQLPVRQRTALLLNLRGEDGECATSFFVATRTASLREIAAALELSAATFVEIWQRLPLSDQEIAERMALTRQQVINLRRSARDRLERKFREKR